MLSVLLEVKSNKSNNIGFYNPATKDFKKFPRTIDGVGKAVQQLLDVVRNTDRITDYQIVIYEGKYAHYKRDMKPWIIINSKGEQIA